MKRDSIIDIAKGLGILMVVFAHTYKGDVQSIIYLFHMPLFFILTGCALSYSKTNDIKWKRLFNGIIIPYLFFSLITYGYWTLIESRLRPVHNGEIIPWLSHLISFKGQQFINIFTALDTKDAFIYNVVLWYLPCLFMCRVIYAKLSKSKYSILIIPVLAILAVLYNEYVKYPLPWCFELALISLPFVLLGQKLYPLYKNSYNKTVMITSIWGGFFC